MWVLHENQILKGLYITVILATISVLGCGNSPVYDESIATPIEQLRDPNAEVRFQAADALVDIGEPAVPALIGELDGSWPYEFNTSASGVLAQIGEPAIPALVEALDDKEVLTRHGAVLALREMGESAGPAVPALIKRLKDKIPLVRSSAALVLGMIGTTTEAAVLALLKVMDDEFMRGYAIAAFGEIGEPIVSELIKATNQKNHRVRENATVVLRLFR
jgi:HEAT repeat protein